MSLPAANATRLTKPEISHLAEEIQKNCVSLGDKMQTASKGFKSSQD